LPRIKNCIHHELCATDKTHFRLEKSPCTTKCCGRPHACRNP